MAADGLPHIDRRAANRLKTYINPSQVFALRRDFRIFADNNQSFNLITLK